MRTKHHSDKAAFTPFIRAKILIPYVISLVIIASSVFAWFFQLQAVDYQTLGKLSRAKLVRSYAHELQIGATPADTLSVLKTLSHLHQFDLFLVSNTASANKPDAQVMLEAHGERAVSPELMTFLQTVVGHEQQSTAHLIYGHQGQHYFASSIAIQDMHGQPIGYIAFQMQVTEYVLEQQRLMNQYVFLIVLATLILMIFYYIYTGRIQIWLMSIYKNLQIEVSERKAAETKLEQQVAERTAQLTQANKALQQDIEARKEAEVALKKAVVEIESHAYYDVLTGLPNRYLILDRLRQATSDAQRNHRQRAVLFLDLDHFKSINDSLGHSAGDELLKSTAERLKSCIREEDTAARLGGDEFVVLLSDVTHRTPISVAAEIVAEKIKASLNRTFMIEHTELHISTSIGITVFPESKNSPDISEHDILRQADTAMYCAKEGGRNAIQFYLPEMQEAIVKRLNMEKDLREAIDKDQFYLCFQPQIRHPEKIEGVEVLLRWKHPERGDVSPAEFIPLAEENGLIVKIGEWVLTQAIQDIAPLIEKIPNLIHVSINVSARQFQEPNFVDMVLSVIDRFHMPPQNLLLEITESVVMEDVSETIEKLNDLKRKGILISMDDFGTGYSSLTYLKSLPIDELKIDQAFVNDIETDKNDAVLVETIISMAQHLGLDVIAEGVETATQVAFLHERGCNRFQGYFFSRPLQLGALVALFDAADG